jgi:quinohemoprotein amine dehydrogenase
MGRVITQRRTKEEWELLVAMHRGYCPLVDTQGNPGFRRRGPPSSDGDGAADSRHPMDKAIAHLAATYPLETDEWTAWSANRRTPRLEGRWAFSGHSVYSGPVYGVVDVTAVEGGEGEFTTAGTLSSPRLGETVTTSGSGIVFTGFQWRGRTTDDAIVPNTFREVMFVERDWRSMSGRSFMGAYDEIGIDVTLRRADGPVVSGVYPAALRTGAESEELTVYGVNLPTDVQPDDIDFGPRVTVTEIIEARDDAIRLRASVATDAVIGKRDLFVVGAARAEAFVVYDTIDAVRVTPGAGMARLGGVVAPKQLAKFEAIGVSNGPDGELGTDDDLDLGALDVTWSLEEYSATFDDDDIDFVGELAADGLFTPAVDGPNPERSGDRNNVGDVWVVATYESEDLDRPLRGRAHLIVTVPLYLSLRGLEPGSGTTPTAAGAGPGRGGRR